jgi:hypothetical protein
MLTRIKIREPVRNRHRNTAVIGIEYNVMARGNKVDPIGYMPVLNQESCSVLVRFV